MASIGPERAGMDSEPLEVDSVNENLEAQVAALKRQLEALSAIKKENLTLKQQLMDQSSQYEQELTSLRTPVTVQVTAPPPAPKLRTFTGIQPTCGNEVNFKDWEAQVEHLRIDATIPNVLHIIKASLRGVALHQVRSCTSVDELEGKLRIPFGDVSLSGQEGGTTASTAPAIFKRERLNGRVCPLSLNNSLNPNVLGNQAKKAVQVIEQGLLNLKPVKLRHNTSVEIRAGEEVELRGRVTGATPAPDMKVSPRPSELLPRCLQIKFATIRKTQGDRQEVCVMLQNLDCHQKDLKPTRVSSHTRQLLKW
ncbi:hypothetical protein ACOMHN_054342 [Nucella lapillus]